MQREYPPFLLIYNWRKLSFRCIKMIFSQLAVKK